MPRITHNFASKDPFNNLTVDQSEGGVVVHLYEHSGSTVIEMSHEEAYRLAQTLLKLAPGTALGYTRDGVPIYPPKPDLVYTQAMVICEGCLKLIRDCGGPISGATCPKCWEKK